MMRLGCFCVCVGADVGLVEGGVVDVDVGMPVGVGEGLMLCVGFLVGLTLMDGCDDGMDVGEDEMVGMDVGD